jgi:hypothetical protein
MVTIGSDDALLTRKAERNIADNKTKWFNLVNRMNCVFFTTMGILIEYTNDVMLAYRVLYVTLVGKKISIASW